MRMKWVLKRNMWLSEQPVRPGVWQRKEGGFFIRGRAINSKTGMMEDVKQSLFNVESPDEALALLEEQLALVRNGGEVAKDSAQMPLFQEYALSLMEEKISLGKIKSVAGRKKWEWILNGPKELAASPDEAVHLLRRFGNHYVHRITRQDVKKWITHMGVLVQAGKYSPHTCNSFIQLLQVIMRSAAADFELEVDPTLKMDLIDTTTHETYPEHDPNAFTPDELARFLQIMKAHQYPHYAMTTLGFFTGLRPSTMRPLRRRGDDADILWDEGILLVRRSHTYGDHEDVMNNTKQGKRYRIYLPEEILAILREHVERLPAGPQQKSFLLFPATDGGLLNRTSLQRPFNEAARLMGFTKRISPIGMRRTYNDLGAEAGIRDIVIRSISGHMTEASQRRYSTVRGQEQREGISKVVSLVGLPEARGAKAPRKRSSSDSSNGGLH